MLKKLSQFFKSLLTKKKPWYENIPVPEKRNESILEQAEREADELIDGIIQNQKNFGSVEQAVQMNLDTGKIIMPDNMSPEETAELEQALQEFKAALQNLTSDSFSSLEDFMKQSSSSFSIPFTTANNLPDAQLQIIEEFSNHEFDTQNWGDYDFVESLVSYENQGYEFAGLEQIYQKYVDRKELTEEEAKKVREWYTLVSQELVYDV